MGAVVGSQTDAALIRGIANGDRGALAGLYDRYSPGLMAVGVRILGDRREAEDVLHDVFLEAWRQAAEYDEGRGTARAWLVMRMRSRCLDRRKAAGFARVVSLDERGPDDAPLAPDDPSAEPDREVLRRALQDLPPEQRTVLELGYFEGLSSTEIAARTEVPVGTVKSRVAAALTKLRAVLGLRLEVAK